MRRKQRIQAGIPGVGAVASAGRRLRPAILGFQSAIPGARCMGGKSLVKHDQCDPDRLTAPRTSRPASWSPK